MDVRKNPYFRQKTGEKKGEMRSDVIANSFVFKYLKENGMTETYNRMEGVFSKVDIGEWNIEDLITLYFKENKPKNEEVKRAFESFIVKEDQGEKVTNSLVVDYLRRLGHDDVAADLGNRLSIDTIPENHRLEDLIKESLITSPVTVSQKTQAPKKRLNQTKPTSHCSKMAKGITPTRTNFCGNSQVPIMSVYGDLIPTLDDSLPIDSLVKKILESNFKVPEIENIICDFTSRDSIRTHAPQLTIGSFSYKSKESEESIIKENFNVMLAKFCPSMSPLKFAKEVRSIKRHQGLRFRTYRRRLNVIGCFLSQGFSKQRFSVDILDKLLNMINPMVKSGRFTPQEDEFVLRTVSARGLNNETFLFLQRKLNRPSATIKKHYDEFNFKKCGFRTGRLDIEELCLLVDLIIKNYPEKDINELENIETTEFTPLEAEMKRPKYVLWPCWKTTIVPLILAFEKGIHHQNNESEILQHLISLKVKDFEDINFSKVKQEKFPTQTVQSLRVLVHRAQRRNDSNPSEYLYQDLEKSLPYFMRKKLTNHQMIRNDRITLAYESALKKYCNKN